MMPSLARAICNFSKPLDMLYKYRVDDTVIKDGLMAICKRFLRFVINETLFRASTDRPLPSIQTFSNNEKMLIIYTT